MNLPSSPGPPLSVGLSIALLPQAGVLAAALLLVVGIAALVLQRDTEPPIDPKNFLLTRRESLIANPGVRWLFLLMLAMGIIVGTIDITSIAFATHLDQPAMASLVLSAYAAGSCTAGLVFGARRLCLPLHRQLLLGSAATAVTTLPLLFAADIPLLTLAVLTAGLFFAPTMIVAMSLVERLVPARQVTESMTWLLAGLNVGVAAGAALSGQVVDQFDTRAGFGVTLCAGVLVLLIAALASRSLRPTLRADSATDVA